MVFVVIPAIFHILGPLLQTMACRRIHVDGARVLGLTFKESVRNTRVVDILRECEACNVRTGVHDLWIDAAEAQHEYGITPAVRPQTGVYDAVIVTVAQRQFRAMGAAASVLGKPGQHVLYDLKYVLAADQADLRS